jgi:tRNA (guanine37-N1)-methyltransferase
MKIDILTLFPGMFKGVFSESMVKIARAKGLVELNIHNLRDWTDDRHRTVDDKPYGGGPGMVMKIEPVDRALDDLKKRGDYPDPVVILLTPQGEKLVQKKAGLLSKKRHVILICGHYEGFDERIRNLVDEEISIGDYILTCGELPAMVLCDSVIRLVPGVLGDPDCLLDESFENRLLEYPQYTRPDIYRDMKVPEVLLGGNHAEISAWREKQAILRTEKRRPDLVEN